jgi:hypothetical protein
MFWIANFFEGEKMRNTFGIKLGFVLLTGTLAWGEINTLVMPAGPFTVGQKVNLSWTVVNVDGETVTGIYFSSTGNAPWDSVAGLSPTTTSYQWTVPNKVSTKAKLWLYHYSTNNGTRTSNPVTTGNVGDHTIVTNAFTIKSATPILVGDKSGHLSFHQTANLLALDFGSQNFRNLSVEVCALNGKTLQASKFQNGSAFSLSTASLPTGNAILRYKAEGLPESSRLILIQR